MSKHLIRDDDRARLEQKYGEGVFAQPPGITKERFIEKLALRDLLDQHFAKASLIDLAVPAMRRTALDRRTRFLVQIGQFTMSKSHGHLADVLQAALPEVTVREALEAILLCHIYGGDTVVEPALQTFADVVEDKGLTETLRDGELPLDGRSGERSLDEERKSWDLDAADDPRLNAYLQRYGWLGISMGLKYKGVQHINILEYRDAIDQEWAGLWLRFGYENVYSRGIFDDRTRLLCSVGDCVAIGAGIQAREHITGALQAGAKAEEVLEVILMSAVHFGFPAMGNVLRVFVDVMTKLGRLDEIGNPPADPQIKRN